MTNLKTTETLKLGLILKKAKNKKPFKNNNMTAVCLIKN